MALLPKQNRVDIIDSVLAESGYKEPLSVEETQNSAREILNRKGGTVDSALGNLVDLMNFSETDSVKLESTKSVLAIHGVEIKNGQSNQNNTQVNFIFQDVSPEVAQQFERVLCPER